jgi:hypothetical protein
VDPWLTSVLNLPEINDIVSQDDWRSFQEIERSVNATAGYPNYAPAQPTVSSQYYTASPSSNAPHTPLSAPFSYQPAAYMSNTHPYSMPNGPMNGHRPMTQSQHGKGRPVPDQTSEAYSISWSVLQRQPFLQDRQIDRRHQSVRWSVDD